LTILDDIGIHGSRLKHLLDSNVGHSGHRHAEPVTEIVLQSLEDGWYTDAKIFMNLALEYSKKDSIERLKQWLTLAEERLKGSSLKLYITGGNDDPLAIDDILQSASTIINPEGTMGPSGGGLSLGSFLLGNVYTYRAT
jgi:Icc-related predicted phosphoesterase